MGSFYVTTPIYYINDVPHIGSAYPTIAADVLARYHRSLGDDTFYLTGTDEHGQKIADAAAAKGTTPRELADQNAGAFVEEWKRLKITNDAFIRTSDPVHEKRVQSLVQRLVDSGDIYLGHYEGWYDVGQEEFVTETEAAGNQFKSAVNGKPLVRYKEPSYFFRMSHYQQRLLDYIAAHPEFVEPETRRNEVTSKIAMGLRDLSISRATLSWGVQMPNDPAHTIYVWIDALFNYYTALGAGDGGALNRFWPADVHIIGKDILWFHAVIWPAVLMALGIELPRKVFAHGWWMNEGQKMSKSLGNFVRPDEVVSRVGLDRFRYFLLREVPFGQDGDFAMGQVIARSDGELANNFGNLLSRTVNMIGKYFDGKLPQPGPVGAQEAAVLEQAQTLLARVNVAMDHCRFHQVIEAALDLSSATNKFIDDTAPFKLAKDPSQRDRLGTILYTCAEATRLVALVLAPIMPDAIERVWKQLPYDPAGAGLLPAQLQWGKLVPGSTITKGEVLFPRLGTPETPANPGKKS